MTSEQKTISLKDIMSPRLSASLIVLRTDLRKALLLSNDNPAEITVCAHDPYVLSMETYEVLAHVLDILTVEVIKYSGVLGHAAEKVSVHLMKELLSKQYRWLSRCGEKDTKIPPLQYRYSQKKDRSEPGSKESGQAPKQPVAMSPNSGDRDGDNDVVMETAPSGKAEATECDFDDQTMSVSEAVSQEEKIFQNEVLLAQAKEST